MTKEEQELTSELSHACKVIISDISIDNTIPITVSPKKDTKLIRSWNIPRSNSLDNNYLTFKRRQQHKETHIAISQGYHTLDDDEETYLQDEEDDDDEDTFAPLLTRSYSYDVKTNSNRELLSTTTNRNWRLANAVGSDIHPDMTHTSRKPPTLLGHEIRISSQYGTIHALTVRGSTIVIGTSNNAVQSFLIQDIAQELSHPILTTSASSESINSSTAQQQQRKSSFSSEIIRSVCFSPATFPKDDNKIIWAGTETGAIVALDIQTNEVIAKRTAIHCHPITFILRHKNTELWTIDHGGHLKIWSVTAKNTTTTSTINLLDATPQSFTLPANIKTAIVSPTKSVLWCSSGRSIDQLDRAENNETTSLIQVPSDLGDITLIVCIPYHPNQIYALHSDGKITAWSTCTLEKIKCFIISVDKLTSVASVGNYHLWVGYRNGSIAIYDTRSEPWIVVKIWKAHSNPVIQLRVDEFSILESMSVVSMDSAGQLAIWDGSLTDDWFEQQMLNNIPNYSTSKETKVMVCSWNMDAAKPDALTDWDVEKIHEWLNGMTDPDIIMIGAQEIIDLTSKAMSAKLFLLLSNKKAETTLDDSEELLTHRYKLWRDYFVSVIDTNFGQGVYKIIKTAQMVGLFSCVFIKATDEDRVRLCVSTVVKTGFRVMTRGLHGNKGGIATRLLLDDTSLCFINCHLASGQSHVVQRNADMEGVINSAKFPSVSLEESTIFNRETDGSNVLDHETCFLSGDLNYRINMNREQVLDLLSKPNSNKFEAWEALQNEDQFKKQQAMNPLFRLFNFKEAPILFDPTYKYDRGTDLYDSSEKKRIPAWCDRVLYRSPATLSNIYYRRHEVRASDHRPISAGFIIPVKTILPEKKRIVKERIEQEWQQHTSSLLQANKVRYITDYDLCDETEAYSRLKMVDWDIETVVLNLYRDKGSYAI